MQHFHSISEFLQSSGLPAPENPMMAVAVCSRVCPLPSTAFTSDFYFICFKRIQSGELIYGRTVYDHNSGSMSFMKPGQIVQFKDLEIAEFGFNIMIHEDYLNGHHLQADMKKYGFFEYEINEALHLSPREEQIIWDLYNKITTEYAQYTDEYSKDIMLSHIASILQYCQRFYKRQFIHRAELSGKTVSRFTAALDEYFRKGLLEEQGLPSVSAVAAQLHLSTRYLSDLLKQETGKTAMELIHIYMIREAKNRMQSADKSISEIAYALGFENLPYFSRLFKKEVGMSPSEFKKGLLN